jgi:hypothetical protein
MTTVNNQDPKAESAPADKEGAATPLAIVGEMNLRSYIRQLDQLEKAGTADLYHPTDFCSECGEPFDVFGEEQLVYCIGNDEKRQQIWLHKACAISLSRPLLFFGCLSDEAADRCAELMKKQIEKRQSRHRDENQIFNP